MAAVSHVGVVVELRAVKAALGHQVESQVDLIHLPVVSGLLLLREYHIILIRMYDKTPWRDNVSTWKRRGRLVVGTPTLHRSK